MKIEIQGCNKEETFYYNLTMTEILKTVITSSTLDVKYKVCDERTKDTINSLITNWLDDVEAGEIVVTREDRKIEVKSKNNYDLCRAIKYIYENQESTIISDDDYKLLNDGFFNEQSNLKYIKDKAFVYNKHRRNKAMTQDEWNGVLFSIKFEMEAPETQE